MNDHQKGNAISTGHGHKLIMFESLDSLGSCNCSEIEIAHADKAAGLDRHRLFGFPVTDTQM